MNPPSHGTTDRILCLYVQALVSKLVRDVRKYVSVCDGESEAAILPRRGTWLSLTPTSLETCSICIQNMTHKHTHSVTYMHGTWTQTKTQTSMVSQTCMEHGHRQRHRQAWCHTHTWNMDTDKDTDKHGVTYIISGPQ